MSNPKFTPGPWQVPNLHHHALYIPIYGQNDKYVSHVPCRDGHDEEAEANAAIIAAAPEMYDFIELVKLTTNDINIYNEAEKILRKARGESEAGTQMSLPKEATE